MGSQDGWARVWPARPQGRELWAKKTGRVCEKHEEAAVVKTDLSAEVKKDQKHEGKKPDRHPH